MPLHAKRAGVGQGSIATAAAVLLGVVLVSSVYFGLGWLRPAMSLRGGTNNNNEASSAALVLSVATAETHSQTFLRANANNQVHVIVYPFTEYGLMCNNVHQISSAIDFALAMPHHHHHHQHNSTNNKKMVVALAFETKFANLMKTALDVEYLQFMLHRAGQVKLPELNPEFDLFPEIELLLDWDSESIKNQPGGTGEIITYMLSPKRFQQRYSTTFSLAVALFVKPHSNLRAQADEFLAAATVDVKPLLSVHRRNMAWCKPTYKKYRPFCAEPAATTTTTTRSWRELTYFEDDCNVTWTPKLAQDLADIWPELGADDKAGVFNILLASDLHDLAGDATFPRTRSIPHQENEEHSIAEELYAQTLQGIVATRSLKSLVMDKTGLDMSWDVSMLVDMWAQVRTRYSIGQPWSSCDRILAMWRSKYSRAAFALFEEEEEEGEFGDRLRQRLEEEGHPGSGRRPTTTTTYPTKCYAEFEAPSSASDTETVVRAMRKWWAEHGLPSVPSTTSRRVHLPPDLVAAMPVKWIQKIL